MKMGFTCHNCGKEFERDRRDSYRAYTMKAYCSVKCTREFHRKRRHAKPVIPGIYQN